MSTPISLRIAAGACLLVSACASTSNLSQLQDAKPNGTAFQQAQFKDYVYLARSFGDTPSGDAAALAEAYAGRALIAASAVDVAPVDPATADQRAVRTRLIAALHDARARVPEEAARAEADYDCWILNGSAASTAASARACVGSLAATLPELEAETGASGS